MKVGIDADEWYPVYTIDRDEKEHLLEVPDELLARWSVCMEEFNALQDEFQKLHEAEYPNTPLSR